MNLLAMKVLVGLAAMTGLCVGCKPPPINVSLGVSVEVNTAGMQLKPAFTKLIPVRPVALLQGAAGRRYLVEQGGRILTFKKADAADAKVFVDISDRVDSGSSEAGLLGMTFHPEFEQNGEVFLSYTRPGNPLTSVVARYISNDGGLTLDVDSEQVLIALDQPFPNNNGGHITFGPDGFLYIAFGDGGFTGDLLGHAQNTDTLFGAILRIDVAGEPYAIPPDNPFVEGGGRPEIYSYGLRNPRRFSFDRETGQLWTGDMGQSTWEEIDVIVNGGNYGWPLREGRRCFEASSCQEDGLIAPVAEYSHKFGCAVTGGYVYRGKKLPTLGGMYIYGDLCTGRIWGLSTETDAVPMLLSHSGLTIASFAEDNDGEIYVIDYEGAVYKISS